jgi:hypothetical protein
LAQTGISVVKPRYDGFFRFVAKVIQKFGGAAKTCKPRVSCAGASLTSRKRIHEGNAVRGVALEPMQGCPQSDKAGPENEEVVVGQWTLLFPMGGRKGRHFGDRLI